LGEIAVGVVAIASLSLQLANKVRLLAFIAVKVFMLETMLPAVKGMIGGVVGTKGAQTFTMVATCSLKMRLLQLKYLC
jgi:hypothetical protein